MSEKKKKQPTSSSSEDDVEFVAKVTFLLDDETNQMFERLGRAAGTKIRGWRSDLLRKLIHEAHAKLENDKSD